MKNTLSILTIAVLVTSANVFGETHYVLPGDRIQPVIDQAKDGDTVAILGGKYPHDVTITKNIKIKKAFGETVEINGDFTVSGLTEPFEINGIIIRGDTDNGDAAKFLNCEKVTLVNLPTGTRRIIFESVKTVTVSGSIGDFHCKDSETVSLTAVDYSEDNNTGNIRLLRCADVNISSSDTRSVYLLDCNSTLNKVKTNGLTLEGAKNSCATVKSEINGNVDIIDGVEDKPYVFFQNTIKGRFNTHNERFFNLTLGYNKMLNLHLKNIGYLKMVGNVVDGFYRGPNDTVFPRNDRVLSYDTFLLDWDMKNNDKSMFYAYNNVFKNCVEKYDDFNNDVSGIRLHSTSKSTIKIYNNVIGNIYNDHPDNKWHRGRGISINRIPVLMEIKGNYFYDITAGRQDGCSPIYAPFDNVKVHNNYSSNCGNWNTGGYRGFDNIRGADTVAEDFVDAAKSDSLPNWGGLQRNYFYITTDLRLKEGSKCINAGPEEPWFFDRDGTRNDIGLFGGSNYDPDGFTTEEPVVLFSNQEPLQFIKGKNKTISIHADGVVAP